MRDRTGLFKRIVSLVIAMSVLFSVGMAVSADSTFIEDIKIGVRYFPGDGKFTYGSDFYLTYTPGYTGNFIFNIKKASSDSDDGLVTIYRSMTGSGTGFGDVVAQWEITESSDYVPHTVELTNNTKYYIRFFKEGAAPQYNFYMDDDPSHSFCDVTLHSNVQGVADKTVQLARGYTSYLPACPFTREGWSLIGWSDTEGGSVLYDDGDLISIAADQEPFDLYAVWGYTLHFDANGGSGDPMPDMVVREGETGYLPECSYTMEGASFVGWSTTADGSTSPHYYPGDPCNSSSSTSFYARYSNQPVYEPLYQLRANSDGAYLTIYALYYGENMDFSPILYLNGVQQSISATDCWIGSKHYARYDFRCSAKDMTDVYTVQITFKDVNGYEHTLFNGSISARSYLLSIINNSSSSPETRNAAMAMLRYGAAAQIYFDGITEDNPDIANYGVEGARMSTLADVTIPQQYSQTQIIDAFSGLQHSKYYGMNLTFTYEMTYMIAFRINSGSSANDAIDEIRHVMGAITDDQVQLDRSGNYCIYRLYSRRLFDIVRYISVNGVRIIMSDYLSRVSQDNSVREDYRNLCLALYGFYEAADNMRSA